MRRIRIGFVLSLLFLMLAGSNPAWTYSCESGGPSQGKCTCNKTDDCKEMRNSGMCAGPLSCSQGKCTCTAAHTAINPGGGNTTGTKPVISPPSSAGMKRQ